MSIQEVIELGKKAKIHEKVYWLSTPWWVVTMLLISVGIFIYLCIKYKKSGIFKDTTFLFLIFIAISIFCYLGNLKVKTTDDISKWRNTVAKTYIESLPVERKEIIAIKIDTQYKIKKGKKDFWYTKYTQKTTMQKTPLIIAYEDNGLITDKNIYETYVTKTNKSKPYIEFQRLNKNLGHGINKGLYNVKVYLPKSYHNVNIQ